MRSLRVKVLALAALLVVFTQVGTIGTLLFAANREVHHTAADKLVTAGTMLRRVLQLRADQLRNTLRVLASERDFVAAVASNDPDALAAALKRSGARVDADLHLVLDAEGHLRGGLAGSMAFPDTFDIAIRNTIEGSPDRTIGQVGSGAFDLTTVPVPAAPGSRPATLTLGVALDNERAQRIARLSGLNVAFVGTGGGDAGTVLFGTSIQGLDTRSLSRSIPGHAARDGQIFELRVAGRDYLAIYQPLLKDASGFGALLLEPLDDALAPYRILRSTVLVLGGLALLVALAGGALAARAITRPIRQLSHAAHRIRNGDYSEPVRVPADDELGMLATAFNTMRSGIAEREERITYQARFDPLTGLPNRLMALERLEQALHAAQAGEPGVGLLVLDLGSFGAISSSLGHEIGDALMAQAAERLRASIDARHLLARLEGDRFAVVVEGMGIDAARELAEDVHRLLGIGLSVHDVNVSLDAVIGIAHHPEHGNAADRLLLRAMVAQEDARAAQQRILVYQDGREEHRARQLAILGDLRRAVRHDELRLYLQPKVSLADGRVCGAEALVRWDHPTLGWLPPGEFIGVAERFGNISLITHWALAAAVRECRLWIEEGLDLTVSVNLSGRDLLDQRLPTFILGLLRDHDLPPRHLTLEVTEEALVRDFSRATLVLQCLRDLGVRIAIDDFGTGYSSLSQIRNLPVDELKIDRSFVMQLPASREDAAIVGAAVDLAHHLGLEVVAEGVESAAALDWLASRHCEAAQGYFISRPMPAEALVDWVHRYRAGRDATPDITFVRAG
ncbi:MAG: EAL domain-containing protein [Gammaproteobacteria bacterium]|nr:EAL domain-containing protein [Gammaproteobacteria bacterium]